jgi:hypothetical protein
MEIGRDTIIKVTEPIILCTGPGWIKATKYDKNNSEYLGKCDLLFDKIVWNGEDDNCPVYSFSIYSDPSDINYPEFTFAEIKAFIADGTFELDNE